MSDDLFKQLSEEELEKIKLPTEEEIKDALEKGRKEADEFLENSNNIPGWVK